MADKLSYKMDYFNTVVKYDPVNYYYIFNQLEIKNVKNSISKENLKQLELEFSELFLLEKMSVTSKESNYVFEDKHNYVSLATYWWKNPDTLSGLPYVDRDGFANPEGAKYDKDKLRLLAYLTYYSGLLYYLTDDKKYYELLKEHCIYWFIGKDTYMNPHMNHGQFIPGVNKGRGPGIIDFAANFSYALHMLTILNKHHMLEKSFYDSLCKWMSPFKDWLISSEIGISESMQQNNHGTMYDLLILILNIFLKDDSDIEQNSYQFLEKRVKYQIDEFGHLPLELKRTKSKSYCLMAAKGINDYFKLLESCQIVIKNHLINKMNDWLVNSLVYEFETWQGEQVTVYDKACLIPLIKEYSRIYNKNIEINIIEKDVMFKVPLYLFK